MVFSPHCGESSPMAEICKPHATSSRVPPERAAADGCILIVMTTSRFNRAAVDGDRAAAI